ncbi:MAG: bifunctional DNA primase/polymerase, partial [Prochloraceae cyanobacterium]|nr:bifunctional DNA primase/polymerase [Prochloraceae cyanobacterium]
MKLNNAQKRLKSALQQYPQYWAITTIDANKRPYRPDWQKEPPLSRKYIEDAIALGEEVQYLKKDGTAYKVRKCPQGLGLRTGEYSNGTLAIDFDGASSIPLYEKLFGTIPLTATFTSRLIAELSPGNLPTRFQILLIIPQQKWKGLKNRSVFKTGVIGKDGKEELLELRWNNSQSVLPGSVHPETGLYSWVPGRSFEEVGVAIANNKIIDALKEKQPLPVENVTSSNNPVVNKKPAVKTSVSIPEACNWSETDWVAYYLARLSPSRADNYQSWLEVGMAAESHGDDGLLQVWDDWSRNSPKYKAG